jgi:hypothetical protein
MSPGAQIIEQRFRILQVRQLEAFGEPVVDFGDGRIRGEGASCIAP